VRGERCSPLKRKKAVRIQDGWLHRLIAQLPDVAFRYRLTPPPGFEYVSPSAETLTGYSPAQYSSLPNLLELFVPTEELAVTLRAPPLRRGDAAVHWGELKRQDGTTIAVERRWVPIWDEEGNLTAIEGLIRQVAGDLPALNGHRAPTPGTDDWRQYADFVQMVAHDIHQSIVTAHVYSGILQRALNLGDLERATSSTTVIESAIHQLDGMIRDFVEGILSEGNEIRLEQQRLDLDGYVAQLVSDVSAQRKIDWIRFEGKDPAIVVADPRHLSRILDNLLTNALKYSDPGAPITLRVETLGDHARISVTDRGIGIGPDDLPCVFQRGFRGREGARKSPGLGLGLYISRILVEAHGGRIWAESTLGTGSTFYVELPLAREVQ
jgi:signal transduction histidine kinase